LRYFGERSCVLPNGFAYHAAANKLPFAAALDQVGFDEDFEVVRNGGRSNALQFDDFTAIHVFLGRDSLENHKPRFIGQRFGDLFDTRTFHGVVVRQAESRWRYPKPSYNGPKTDTTQ
jgi:hypothetical protein